MRNWQYIASMCNVLNVLILVSGAGVLVEAFSSPRTSRYDVPVRQLNVPRLLSSGGSTQSPANGISMSHRHQDETSFGEHPTAIAATAVLTPSSGAELFFDSLEMWYSRSIQIKCPFFRRRAADTIDGLAMIGRFLLIRHKSLGIHTGYMPPGCRAMDLVSSKKHDVGLDAAFVASMIEHDWKKTNNKGYYITGRLNTTVYRDDCLFSGPDPDMPVRGLRKYLGAASHLFDSSKSQAELLSLTIVDTNTVKATWKLGCVLMLPWRPTVPSWRGSTIYHLDKDGLVYHHEEQWDKSALEGFVTTIWPKVGRRIWSNHQETEIIQ